MVSRRSSPYPSWTFHWKDESNCDYDAVHAYAGDGTSGPEIFE